MKVAYITLNHKGGMIHYVSQLIGGISSKIEPVLITGMIKDQKLTLKEKIIIYRFSLKIHDLPFMLFKLKNILEEFKPDLIHLISTHYSIFLSYCIIKKYPIIVTLHDVTPHMGERDPIRTITVDKHINVANMIIVHCERLKNQLVQKGYPKDKIRIIPHGDYSFFLDYTKHDTNEEENTILFFGRIEDYKGLEYLIKSIPLISTEYPDIKLIIAGSGDFTKYKDMIRHDRNYEVHNRFISDEEVSIFFQRAKVVVLPYIEGTQSGIIPIAYAFKRPVVVTDVGCIPEVVEDEKTGFIVPPRDTKALANAIIKLLKDDELRKQMGENAYKKMKEDLSWDKIADTTMWVYREVIGDKRC